MIIAISGTPGTGKTSVAKILTKLLDGNLMSIKSLIKKHKIPYNFDKKRNTKEVSIRDLQKSVKKSLIKNKINIIEGHMSHFIPSDNLFVLICNPLILRKRLQKRRWSKKKIDENILAEILQIIQSESKNPYIINTTTLESKKAAEKILKIIKNPKSYKQKSENWLKKYKKLAIELEN